MQLAFTPSWLRSNVSSCGSDPTKAAPADVNAWAVLAKSIVAHMDQKFRRNGYGLRDLERARLRRHVRNAEQARLLPRSLCRHGPRHQAAGRRRSASVFAWAVRLCPSMNHGVDSGAALERIDRSLRGLRELSPVFRGLVQYQRRLEHDLFAHAEHHHRSSIHLRCRRAHRGCRQAAQRVPDSRSMSMSSTPTGPS